MNVQVAKKYREGDRTVTYSVRGYEERARECVKFANQATDNLIRSELLRLRQTYLTIAKRLRDQGFETDVARSAGTKSTRSSRPVG